MPALRVSLRVLLALAGLVACAGASAQPAHGGQRRPQSAPAAAIAPAAGASAAADAAASAPAKPKAPLPPREQYSEKGADTCLECHDDVTPGYSGAAIFKGKHGHRMDKRAPFGPGGLQCEACHGPGARHAAQQEPAIDQQQQGELVADGAGAQPDVPRLPSGRREDRLACQRARAQRRRLRRLPPASTRTGDPVLAKSSRARRLLHAATGRSAADFQKPSTHPVRFGLMGCSDCHSPHGSTTTAMLNKPTLNQTCFSCHADKRGPLLWEHAPVAEDCSLCHTAHGSVRSALLTKTPPLLCQQCHSPADHPSVARTSQSLPGGSAGRVDLSGRGRLHQLPLAGAWQQSPGRSQADALTVAPRRHSRDMTGTDAR